MSLENDFVPFAAGVGANIEAQATYLTDTNRTLGNQPGIASSALNNKALRQGTYIAANLAQYISNVTQTNTLDDGNSTEFLAQLTAALQILPPTITTHLSGTGTHYLTYYFFVSGANATANATYTNNGFTFTVSSTISSGALLQCTGTGAPLVSGTLTKASGTGDSTIAFYAVRAPLVLRYKMVGGGGGGGGAGTGSATSGGSGGNTTFGSSTSGGGSGGAPNANPGSGGSVTLGSGSVGVALAGSSGQGGTNTANTTANLFGGNGGPSPFGGAGGGGEYITPGTPGVTNSGSGGGGGGTGVSGGATGPGGGGGAFIDAAVTGSSLSASFSWGVGAAGTAGSGTSGNGNGAAGGSGAIYVEEGYQ